MKRTQENDKLHVIRQRMEKYKRPINNGNAGVQYFFKDIFYLFMNVFQPRKRNSRSSTDSRIRIRYKKRHVFLS